MKNAILQENNKKPKGKGRIFWLRNNNWEESAINRQIWVEKPHRGPRKLVNAWNFASFFFTQGTKKIATWEISKPVIGSNDMRTVKKIDLQIIKIENPFYFT